MDELILTAGLLALLLGVTCLIRVVLTLAYWTVVAATRLPRPPLPVAWSPQFGSTPGIAWTASAQGRAGPQAW
jgi:hypothetical protein